MFVCEHSRQKGWTCGLPIWSFTVGWLNVSLLWKCFTYVVPAEFIHTAAQVSSHVKLRCWQADMLCQTDFWTVFNGLIDQFYAIGESESAEQSSMFLLLWANVSKMLTPFQMKHLKWRAQGPTALHAELLRTEKALAKTKTPAMRNIRTTCPFQPINMPQTLIKYLSKQSNQIKWTILLLIYFCLKWIVRVLINICAAPQ